MPLTTAASAQALQKIDDFTSLVTYLREELDWEIPELPQKDLTYSYTADELGLKSDAKVDIQQLRPILGQSDPWGVFFIDFDRAELPVTLLRRLLAGVSRKQRESANPSDRALFAKNDLIFVSAYGKADERRLALAHFHQEPSTSVLPTLRVIELEPDMKPVQAQRRFEQIGRLRWPGRGELIDKTRERWASAFVDRPREAIRTSKEMAAALAEAAKTIRHAIEAVLPKEKRGQPLAQLFEAVKATLSKDLDVPKFADTYAQTLAYGLLAKRMDQVQRWRSDKAATLDDDLLPLPRITVEALETALPTNPFLSDLLGSFLTAVGREGPDGGTGPRLDFDVLGIGDLVDLLNTANIDAVLADFDKDKAGDDPVVHFYEGFLAAYDKAMKVQRGVFYTPKPVVGFIVRSVDEVLRTEFGLKDGLADTTTWGEFVAAHPEATIPHGVGPEEAFVKILDPATGTGTFLVEVIDLIHRRLTEETWKGKSKAEQAKLWNAWVPQQLMPRLYGYELMMAPYAVAHMKIGLKLADTGYDFSGHDAAGRPARARVFLTNALEPPQDLDMQLAFMNEALAHEARAANDAKAKARFTVVMGNPPYSGHSANNNVPWIVERVIDYRRDWPELNKPGQGKWLQDDYVKFFRVAEQIAAEAGCAIFCFISNHSWLDNPTFKGMRSHLRRSFNKISVIDLHGNINKKERAPDGGADENVFGTIVQGVALIIARSGGSGTPGLDRSDVFGKEDYKLEALKGSSLSSIPKLEVRANAPGAAFLDSAVPQDAYLLFPSLTGILDRNGDPAPAIVTTQDEFAISFTREEEIGKVELLLSTTSETEARDLFSLCTQSQWSYANAKSALNNSQWRNLLTPISYRPFDERWTVYDSHVAVHRRHRMSRHMLYDWSEAILTTRQTKEQWGCLAVRSLAAHKSLSAYDISYSFPLWLETISGPAQPNLSPSVISRLETICRLRFDCGSDAPAQPHLPGTDPPPPAQAAPPLRRERGDLTTTFGPRDVFDWIYAVLHSPQYRTRYADFLKSDFARVPLPRDRALFAALVPLGMRLLPLHLLDPVGASELADPKVTLHAGKAEARLDEWGEKRRAGVHRDPTSGRVYINADHWFSTVPQGAWEHWIGGYQPAQKWLKDRSRSGSGSKLKPGRVLTDNDILHYRRMIVALTETAKIQADIDTVIAAHGGWPDAFKGITD